MNNDYYIICIRKNNLGFTFKQNSILTDKPHVMPINKTFFLFLHIWKFESEKKKMSESDKYELHTPHTCNVQLTNLKNGKTDTNLRVFELILFRTI